MSRFLSIGTVKGKDAFVVERVVGKEELSRMFEYRVDLSFRAWRLQGQGHPRNQCDGWHGDARRRRRSLFQRLHHPVLLSGPGPYPGIQVGVGLPIPDTLSPWIWFLTRTSTCAIFQQKKILEVIEEIFDRVSELKSVDLKVNGETETRDYNVQYRETDFNFFSRIDGAGWPLLLLQPRRRQTQSWSLSTPRIPIPCCPGARSPLLRGTMHDAA